MVKLQIAEKIFKILFILSLFLWMYHLYLSMLSYNDSVSAPYYIDILFSTRVYVGMMLGLGILFFTIRHQRQKLTALKLNIHVMDYFRKHPLRWITISITTFLLGIGIVIVVIQPMILFHPNHSEYAQAYLVDLNIYKTYEIEDGKLSYHGLGKVDDAKKLPTILYFGGNGESSAQSFYQYHTSGFFEHFEGFQIIMIDYPNYGLSDGKTHDKSILSMGDTVYQYIKTLDYVDENQIYIYGYSIGTGVSTYIASKYDVKGLILIAPYSSITDLFNTRFPIFKGVFKYLIVEEFESSRYAADVEVSPLIIASLDDKTIPYALSEKLADSFSNSYELFTLNDVEHNEFLDQDRVIDKIISYINL